MNNCSICGEYLMWSNHTCKPCYYVWQEDYSFQDVYDSKYHKIYASDPEKAAIKFAEQDWEFPDTNVYVILRDDADELWEDDLNDGNFIDTIEESVLKKAKKFEIEGEMIRVFSASEFKEIK